MSESRTSIQTPTSSGAVTDPVLAALERIDARMSWMQERLDRLELLAHEGQGIAAMMGDTFDQHVGQLRARGIDVEERALALLRIVEKATSPELTQRLEHLMARTAHIEATLAAIGEIPNLAATTADALDTTLANLQARGINLDERLDAMWIAAERLTSPSALRALQAMFDIETPADAPCLQPSVQLSPMLQVLVDAADSVTEARQRSESLGPWGLFRALAEPEVQRAFGFAVSVARGLGRRLMNTTVTSMVPSNGSRNS
jgi:hypothetical protein